MSPRQLSLQMLFYKGFNGGLRWETQNKDVYDERLGREVKKHHFLLNYPHSIRLAKVIERELKTTRLIVVSLALSHIYDFATEKIGLCKDLEPQEFFALAKNSFSWSSKISDQGFWAFTYKAFHARAIFLNTVLAPNRKPPPGQPLSQALDRFLEEFLLRYPIHQTRVLEKGDTTCQENIELAEDQVSMGKPVYDKYFPYQLTHHEAQGDGADKLVLDLKSTRGLQVKCAPVEYLEELDLSKVPDKELFFYDTECRTKHHDAFLDLIDGKQSVPSRDKESSKGKGVVRKYDSFREYREVVSKEGDEDEEEGVSRDAEQQEEEDSDDVMGEAGVDNYLPEAKRLKSLKLD
ncbi:hypothetical protein F4781DRAFT_438515 [Annulohypoxylon bovei var. microspora]|nr:hypothetical protein F4781DRAFT_438515 [Annulohypoxylon bovei var. microspora]